MCNAYRLGRDTRDTPPLLPEGLLRDLSVDRLIRRTDHAPVYNGGTDLVTMRWGFERPGLGTVNNSREDKLDGPMWRKAFRERRCLVPATGYYEFSGPKGLKRTHFFTRADGAWMWIAGIWEESSEHGPCFSMITTEPNATVLPFHDRMPVVLEPEEIEDFLAGRMRHFKPPAEKLSVVDAVNPLLKTPRPVQGELF